LIPRLSKPLPALLQEFGNDPGPAHDRHIVRISGPAGNNVQMDVLWKASPSHIPKVNADVETGWRIGHPQHCQRLLAQCHHLEQTVRRESLDRGNVLIRHHEDMPAVVGKHIETHITGVTSTQDIFCFVVCVQLGTKDTLFRVAAQRLDVTHSPGGPEIFHMPPLETIAKLYPITWRQATLS